MSFSSVASGPTSDRNLADTPGPSPWYLRRPDLSLPSARGPLVWRPAGDGGQRSGKTLLVAPSGEPLLVLDFHCYVQPLAPPRFLVWHPEGEGPAEGEGSNYHDAMSLRLWNIRPREGTVEVIPQDWFNRGDYDFGYQWVTRVAREPGGRIVGEGIRIDAFVLDETGRQVSEWLSTNPFAWTAPDA